MTAEQKSGAQKSWQEKVTPEAKKILDKTQLNGYATVIFDLAVTHKTNLANLTSRQEGIAARRDDYEKNFAGVKQVLEQVKEVDEQVIYSSGWIGNWVEVTAPKGLINVLADRDDVTSVDTAEVIAFDA